MRTQRFGTRQRTIRLILVCILILILSGCRAYGEDDRAALRSKLERAVPAAIASGLAPSAQVALVRGEQIIWAHASGENSGIDRIYMNASVQKLFTATAIMQLVERGLIELEEDINAYLPFPVRHPQYPQEPITVRMLLAHRSGLDAFPYQFAWDTESTFAPAYRSPAPPHIQVMSLEEYLHASLVPEGSNYDVRSWVYAPDERYHYSVSAYPLLRYLIGQVSGQRYDRYMREQVFAPLGMTGTGFSADEVSDRHAIPYTRLDADNIELPLWNGNGYLMHTTATDMAQYLATLMNAGQSAGAQILEPETIALMQKPTSRFRVLFRRSADLQTEGPGLGLNAFRGGWYGIGGSAPGYQSLLRYHPERKVGYVILTNVNAILSGGDNYASARGDIYAVQDALISVLDPTLWVRSRWTELLLILSPLLVWSFIVIRWLHRRRSPSRNGERSG